MTSHLQTETARLAVRIDGEPGMPWLILANSLGSDMSLWEPQMAMLLSRRRVLRFDQPGHGDSGAPSRASMADLAADIVAIMDAHAIAKADLVGLSMGGMTALGLAIHHPERLRRAVCTCARASFPPPAIVGWDERIQAVEQGGMAAIVAGTLSRWFTPDAPQALRDHAEAMLMKTSVAGYIACVEALKGLDHEKHLGDISVPMLYLAGEHDMAAPAAAMRAMAEATPGAQMTVIEGAAHIANMEAPAAFDAALAGFLFTDD
jgi:3-oxoadipate enol-lactonase